jgi:hypothetical protein
VISTFPDGFVSRVPFFSPAVACQVAICRDFIAKERAGWMQDLFRVAFGAVMVSFSNYSYEPSLGTRVAAGKPNVDYADVIGTVARKLWEMYEDILTFQRWMAKFRRVPQGSDPS